MIKTVFSLFLLGHVLGDFYFQSNHLAKVKNQSWSKLREHGLIYFLSMVFLLIPIFGFRLVNGVLLVSLIHFFIDAGMAYLYRKQSLLNRFVDQNQTAFYIGDQLAHLLTILGVTLLLYSDSVQYTNWFQRVQFYLSINSEIILNWGLAIVLIMKPVSITISKVLDKYQPTTVIEEEFGHPGAGSLIGILERLIILVMLAQNQYGAIGFVLTAKSIARYNKIAENPQFSEYYLLGTLLSMLLVIVTYTLIFG